MKMNSSGPSAAEQQRVMSLCLCWTYTRIIMLLTVFVNKTLFGSTLACHKPTSSNFTADKNQQCSLYSPCLQNLTPSLAIPSSAALSGVLAAVFFFFFNNRPRSSYRSNIHSLRRQKCYYCNKVLASTHLIWLKDKSRFFFVWQFFKRFYHIMAHNITNG